MVPISPQTVGVGRELSYDHMLCVMRNQEGRNTYLSETAVEIFYICLVAQVNLSVKLLQNLVCGRASAKFFSLWKALANMAIRALTNGW
jgi:hypothetical protein